MGCLEDEVMGIRGSIEVVSNCPWSVNVGFCRVIGLGGLFTSKTAAGQGSLLVVNVFLARERPVGSDVGD